MPRLDTTTESAGAEFLVLGHLLIQGIQAFKAHGNSPGFDLVATNPDNRRSVTIEVKSRTENSGTSFPIKRFDSDFVVLVKLNRGVVVNGALDASQAKPPEFYVFNVDFARTLSNESVTFRKAILSKKKNFAPYREAWHLIAEALGNPTRRTG